MEHLLRYYPEYTPSGVEWLGDVPAHWEVRPLKHWVGINEAVLPETTDPDFEFHYLEIGAVGTGVLIEEPNRICFADAPSRARRIVKNGDTIISTVRTYLKAVWTRPATNGNLICSTGFAVLTPREGVAPGFLGYLVQSNPFTDPLTAESVGIAYPAIGEERFSSLRVCFPPLPEQITIVRYVDHVDERISRYISAKERLINLLEDQRQTVIKRAVTRGIDPNVRLKPSEVEWLGYVPTHWEVTSVKQHYSVQLGKMLQNKPNNPDDVEVPYLKAQHVQWFQVRTTDAPKMWASQNDIDQFGKIASGDLLVCEGGEGGRCGILKQKADGYIIQNALHRVRARKQSRNDFLQYIMCVAAATGWFDAINDKATIAHFTREKFDALRVPIPSFTEQTAIVEYLDKATTDIDSAIDRARREIELLKEYRTRLIADVVTGKLDVREAAFKLPEAPDGLRLSDKQELQSG